jgi:chromosomal replication initiator protein
MLNTHARFATFVIGSANRLAATAAKAVAEAPGAMYNPLFIYARPGLGKTHLLMAIGNEALAIDPARTVLYVTVDDFVEAWQAALAAGEAEAYRRRFTAADLVLVDDAQLLSDRRELQAELLRVIDVLAAADRQIVLAGDRPPEEIQALDERLIRRFAGGLVIDIGAPDYETRLAILGRRASERQVSFPSDVLPAVAELPIHTVRELLGALNRLIAQQAVQADPITATQARTLLAALGHVGTESATAPTVPVTPVAETPAAPDEFSDFLSDLSATVAQRVDQWRRELTEAALRWNGEGFRTARLDHLLAGDLLEDPVEALAAFAADVARLRALQAEVATLAPDLLQDSVFFDPDRVAEAETLVADARDVGPPLPGPSPRFVLDGFAEGASSRPVLEAIRAAAAAPGQRWNPLVIVGRPGAGKTHLLHAFGHALRASGLARVAVLEARQFVDGLVAALGEGDVPRWRQRLRRVDALLLDDVAVLSGKERSQEELYLLYNLLLESGRQLAFTSSVPPSELTGFEPRLATRLAAGLVVELGLPDREAKVREVERLLGAAAVDPDLVDYLASRPAATLRELQQLVQRVTEAADGRGQTLSLTVARGLIEGEPVESSRPARRGAGLLSPGAGALRSREKMIDTWPDATERLIEEWG